MTKRSPPAERLYQARRAAAKELGRKVTDPKVIRLATLQAAYDQVQAQIAASHSQHKIICRQRHRRH